jgi:uncharacterized protein with FMN-binding domain
MKKRYKALIIIGAVVVALVAACAIAFSVITNNLQALETMEIRDVDLAAIADGVYGGSYSNFPLYAEVSVTIEDHVIADIDLVKHTSGKGQAAEVIPGMVVEAQSLNVDAVSGATSSSKAILKAIENALGSGRG